jgi:hypothetical protein
LDGVCDRPFRVNCELASLERRSGFQKLRELLSDDFRGRSTISVSANTISDEVQPKFLPDGIRILIRFARFSAVTQGGVRCRW